MVSLPHFQFQLSTLNILVHIFMTPAQTVNLELANFTEVSTPLPTSILTLEIINKPLLRTYSTICFQDGFKKCKLLGFSYSIDNLTCSHPMRNSASIHIAALNTIFQWLEDVLRRSTFSSPQLRHCFGLSFYPHCYWGPSFHPPICISYFDSLDYRLIKH